jgi:hypothetical protein
MWALQGFDPRQLLPEFGHHAEVIQHVVGRIAVSAANASNRQQRAGWAPIRWADASRLFGRSGTWNRVRKRLLDLGILECDESYSVGRFAKAYRLGPAWRDIQATRVPITDKRLLARLARKNADRRRSLTPATLHLDNWLKLVRIDEKSIKRFICQTRKTDKRNRSEKQHLTKLKVAILQSGTAEVTRCDYGRVHSALTNLRKEVRPALRIHGRELAEVDVSGCQPLLVGFIAAMLFAGDWTLNDVRRLGHKGDLPDAFATLALERWSSEPPPDVLAFIDICERGEFYETVAALWELAPGMPRKKIKGLTFRIVLFGRSIPGNFYWDKFARRFPSIALAIEEIKRYDHATLSRACQRIEARLMVEGVVATMAADRPDVPVQSIHDSLLVYPEHVAYTESIIRSAFNHLGLAPSLKAKAHRHATTATA